MRRNSTGRGARPLVERLEDRSVPAVVTITTTADDLTPNDGSVSLREAITAVNAGNDLGDPDITNQNPGTFGTSDTINFNITGTGVKTIAVTSALPTLTTPVTINGYSQTGASANTQANADDAVLLIELNGTAAGSGADGLTLGLGSGGSTVRGLVVNRFPGNGIVVQSDGNTVAGNFVGVNPAGTVRMPNGTFPNSGDGIRVESASNNVIGGTAAADRNVASGNAIDGIHVVGTLTAPATGNRIEGNFVGVGADGKSGVGNRTEPAPAPGAAEGNNLFGIEISGGNNNTVGGTAAGARNVVGLNGAGIEVDNGGQHNVIRGNFAGVGADGVTPAGNLLHGIVLRSNNGFSAPLGPAQPNEPGVSFNQVGGTVAGAGNLVMFNGTGGIAVFGNPVSASGQPNVGNSILGNSVFLNGRNSPTTLLGIDLTNGFLFPKDDGPTANDSKGHLSADAPNHFQNFPVLSSVAVQGGQTVVIGSLSSPADAPGTTFRVEFFASDPDPLGGIPEGQQFLGSADVTTGAGGVGTFTATLPVAVAVGRVITATATDNVTGDTSEFSAGLTVNPPNTPPTISDVQDQTVVKNGTVGPIQFTVNDAETPAGNLTVTATSSDTTLVPQSGIVIGGSGQNRTVTITPASGFVGATTITLTVTDAGGLTASDTFALTVNSPPNTPPVITTVPNQTLPHGGDALFAGPLSFIVSDAETPASGLTGTATSSNTTLVPASGVQLAGTGATRTVTVTPAAGQSGTATITLAVADPGGLTATSTFTVTVLPGGATGRPRSLSVGGAFNGVANVYTPSAAGAYSNPPARVVGGGVFTPFAGDVRTATGDFNGDGVEDTVLVTGPGVPTRMAVVSGKDGSTLLAASDPFGDANFTFGGFVTAGDIDHDGRAEWVVTPELRGGPRVVIFGLNADGTLRLVANFFGIQDDTFRDGARAALGDVNKDGVLDVFAIAAFNGGPRTALYDGKDVLIAGSQNRAPNKLTGDFFASLSGTDEGRGGRYIAAGDVNGDGVADLIVTGDNLLGTGNQVIVFSGADLIAGKFPGVGANPIANFTVSGQPGTALLSLATVNADGDAKADVAVGSGAGQPSLVKVYLGKDLSGTTEPANTTLDPFGIITQNGVFVG